MSSARRHLQKKSNTRLPASLAIEVNKFHAGENEYIAREYLKRKNGKLFYSPMPNAGLPSKTDENPPIEQLINEIIAPLLLQLTKKNDELSAKILNLNAIKLFFQKKFNPPTLFIFRVKINLYSRYDKIKLMLVKLKIKHGDSQL